MVTREKSMATLLDLFGSPVDLARRVPIPTPVRELLSALDVDPATLAAWPGGGAGAQQSDVTDRLGRTLLGFFQLDLIPGGRVFLFASSGSASR
jgi:hypothetical protein